MMFAWFRCLPFTFRLHRLHDEPIVLALWRCVQRRRTRLGTKAYWRRYRLINTVIPARSGEVGGK